MPVSGLQEPRNPHPLHSPGVWAVLLPKLGERWDEHLVRGGHPTADYCSIMGFLARQGPEIPGFRLESRKLEGTAGYRRSAPFRDLQEVPKPRIDPCYRPLRRTPHQPCRPIPQDRPWRGHRGPRLLCPAGLAFSPAAEKPRFWPPGGQKPRIVAIPLGMATEGRPLWRSS